MLTRGLGRVFGKRLAAERYGCTGVTAPTPHAPRAVTNRPASLQAGARSSRRGFRVGVVVSVGGGFVWVGVFLRAKPALN